MRTSRSDGGSQAISEFVVPRSIPTARSRKRLTRTRLSGSGIGQDRIVVERVAVGRIVGVTERTEDARQDDEIAQLEIRARGALATQRRRTSELGKRRWVREERRAEAPGRMKGQLL